ncbi:hypothetical protein Btru_009182 [Bulinus truncatus]|nr:hypothetical protein Btru_009182 [Bulinus truncatus]
MAMALKFQFTYTLLLAGCSCSAQNARLTMTNLGKLTSASNDFSRGLYAHVSANKSNVILSPFGVHVSLSMVYLGSRESTAEQMKRTLQLVNVAGPHAMYRELVQRLNAMTSVEMLIVDALWVNRNYNVSQQFKNAVGRQYLAEVKMFDTTNAGSPEAAINSWVKERSKGKIASVVSPGGISTQAGLVLVNALLLNANWASPFDREQTSKSVFYRSNGSTVQVDMMRQVSRMDVKMSASPHTDVIRMPLANEGIAFYVALPRSASGLPALETIVTANSANLEALFTGFQNTRVDLYLPRFSLTSTKKLKSTLSGMGMPIAFSEQANFSAISNSPLVIHDVIQKAVIEVQELGTVASSAVPLAIAGYATAHEVEPPVLFKADHPFMFFIRDDNSRLILLQGKLSDPSTSIVLID